MRQKNLLEAAEAMEVERKREREEWEAKRKREREEWEAERYTHAEEIRNLHKDFQNYLTKKKEQWAEERCRIEKKKKELGGEEKDRVVIHVEVKGNKIGRRHEERSHEESIMCYSDETNQARCLHIEVSGYDTFTKVRNVRWPSGKSKLVTVRIRFGTNVFLFHFLQSLHDER